MRKRKARWPSSQCRCGTSKAGSLPLRNSSLSTPQQNANLELSAFLLEREGECTSEECRNLSQVPSGMGGRTRRAPWVGSAAEELEGSVPVYKAQRNSLRSPMGTVLCSSYKRLCNISLWEMFWFGDAKKTKNWKNLKIIKRQTANLNALKIGGGFWKGFTSVKAGSFRNRQDLHLSEPGPRF